MQGVQLENLVGVDAVTQIEGATSEGANLQEEGLDLLAKGSNPCTGNSSPLLGVMVVC